MPACFWPRFTVSCCPSLFRPSELPGDGYDSDDYMVFRTPEEIRRMHASAKRENRFRRAARDFQPVFTVE